MPISDDPYRPQFFSADLCAAAQIDGATLKNWIGREPSALQLSDDDRRAVGAGRPHLFTLRTVMQAAICAKLVRLGLAPRRAGSLAALFMNFGRSDAKVKFRPGELFPTGTTLLVAYPVGPQEEKGEWGSQAINITPESTFSELFPLLNGGREVGAIVLNLSELFDRVQKTLGINFSPAAP